MVRLQTIPPMPSCPVSRGANPSPHLRATMMTEGRWTGSITRVLSGTGVCCRWILRPVQNGTGQEQSCGLQAPADSSSATCRAAAACVLQTTLGRPRPAESHQHAWRAGSLIAAVCSRTAPGRPGRGEMRWWRERMCPVAIVALAFPPASGMLRKLFHCPAMVLRQIGLVSENTWANLSILVDGGEHSCQQSQGWECQCVKSVVLPAPRSV